MERRTLARALLLAPLLIAGGVHADQDAPTEVRVIEHAVGSGKTIVAGAYVVLHYSGFVYDASAPDNKGHRFADSRERGEALSYKYGLKRAIPGLEKGMRGMRVGGRRTIVVPARLAYDELKYPWPKDVPPGSAVVFDVELLDIVPEGAPPQD